jgi:hypothetical protein
VTDGKKPKPLGACDRCGMIATDYSQLDKTHRPCGGTIQPSYRLAPMEECGTCGATGTAPGALGICNDCGGNGWLVARTDAGSIKLK